MRYLCRGLFVPLLYLNVQPASSTSDRPSRKVLPGSRSQFFPFHLQFVAGVSLFFGIYTSTQYTHTVYTRTCIRRCTNVTTVLKLALKPKITVSNTFHASHRLCIIPRKKNKNRAVGRIKTFYRCYV